MRWIFILSIIVLSACSSSDDDDQSPSQVVQPVSDPADPDPPVDDPPVDDPPVDDPPVDDPPVDDPPVDDPPVDDPPVDDPPDSVSVINRDNHEIILLDVFKVFTGEAFSHRFDEIPTDVSLFGDIISEGFTDEADPANSTPTIYSCENGGTVSVLFIDSFFIESSTDFVYSNCQVGSMLLEGDYTTFIGGKEEFSSTEGRSSQDGLTMSGNAGSELSFTGRYDDGCCTTRFDSISLSFSENFRLQISEADERLEISDANSEYTNGELGFSPVRVATMTGGFKLLSTETDETELTATVLSDFDYTSAEVTESELEQLATSWTFTTGILSVTAEDGSEVILNAESGDTATAAITIKTADGEEMFDQPWSLWTSTLTGQALLKLRNLLAANKR